MSEHSHRNCPVIKDPRVFEKEARKMWPEPPLEAALGAAVGSIGAAQEIGATLVPLLMRAHERCSECKRIADVCETCMSLSTAMVELGTRLHVGMHIVEFLAPMWVEKQKIAAAARSTKGTPPSL